MLILFIIDIFYTSCELILSHLLRYDPFEVDDHVFMGRRLHLNVRVGWSPAKMD